MTDIATKVSDNLLIRRAERDVYQAALTILDDLKDGIIASVLLGSRLPSKNWWAYKVDYTLLPALADVYTRAFDVQTGALSASLRAATPPKSRDAQTNAERYLRAAKNRLVDVADTVFAQVKRFLAENVGLSQADLAAGLEDILDSAARARTVARTETTPALNAGRLQAARAFAKAEGVSMRGWSKTWASMEDERVRHTHAEADGQTVPLNTYFTVGGHRGRFPGDPTLPPDETINCRCTLRIAAGGSLTADGGDEDTMTDLLEETFDLEEIDPETSVPWHGVLAPENTMSGDRRKFALGALSFRDLPVPLHYQEATDDGHRGSVRVANIQGIQRATNEDGTPVMRAWGEFDAHDTADEAIRQIAKQMLRGVSVDVDMPEMSFEDEFGNDVGNKSPMEVPNPIMVLTAGRISGATLCSIPAFQEAYVALGEPPEDWGVADIEDRMAEQDSYAAQVSDKPWSGFTQGDYTDEQWYRACVLHKNGDSKAKGDNGLPIREPSGALNRNAVHAAAARVNQVSASSEAKSAAMSALRGAYKTLHEDPPEVLTAAAPKPRDDSLDSDEDPGTGGGRPKISTKPWGNFAESDYTPEQWARACALHYKPGRSMNKADHTLPYREPDGSVNVEGTKKAAEQFAKVQASGPAKAAAQRRLRRAYDLIGEDAPPGLAAGPQEESSTEVAEFDDSGIPGHLPQKLKAYWTHGEGAAKIAWGTGGDFERCRTNLGQYVPKQMLSGLCAKLHKAATGQWPGKGKARAHALDESAAPALTSRCEPCETGLTASGSQHADFADPALDRLTPLTVTEDGRVFGHLAGWGTCHIGFDGVCVTPPTSTTNYAYFHTGEVLTADEWRIPVGHITMGTGHAAPSLRAAPAVEHYDNTGTVVADICVGDDEFGIWLAGRLRPGVTSEQKAVLAAAALSGDWRRVGGAMELVAALAVNVPGFPIPRLAASMLDQQQTALVASGIVTAAQPEAVPIGQTIGEYLRRQRRAEAAATTVTTVVQQDRIRRARAAVAAVLAIDQED